MHRRYQHYSSSPAFLIVSAIVIVACAVAYILHVPSTVIVSFVMVGLLLTAMIAILLMPFIEGWGLWQIVRGRLQVRNIKLSDAYLDTMTWREFEWYVAKWLAEQGYADVEQTEQYDLGVDITAKKNGIRWGVQVKHYTNLVGINAVRATVAALKEYKCDKAMIVTNSYFSWPAKELAKSNECTLIDRDTLQRNRIP